MASYGTFGTANLVSYVHEVGASTSQLLYHEEVLSAQHGAISCRFRHQQGKAMRVGGTIYFDDLRTYSSDVDRGEITDRAPLLLVGLELGSGVFLDSADLPLHREIEDRADGCNAPIERSRARRFLTLAEDPEHLQQRDGIDAELADKRQHMQAQKRLFGTPASITAADQRHIVVIEKLPKGKALDSIA